jgi:hypothetical protein
MKKALALAVILLMNLIVFPANAAGVKPKISIDCGLITGDIDENGTFGSFNPTVKITYYGLPLKVTAYYSEAPNTPRSEMGQKITTVEGKASSSKFYRSDFDFSYKFLQFGQSQTGFYQMDLVAVDSLKRTAKASCRYQKFYFTFPIRPYTQNSDLFTYKKSCSLNGIELFGKVQLVNYGADFKVQVVDYGADLNVKQVSYGAYSCGEWQIVDYGADFKVQLVNYGADFKIKMVTYGAGI